MLGTGIQKSSEYTVPAKVTIYWILYVLYNSLFGINVSYLQFTKYYFFFKLAASLASPSTSLGFIFYSVKT